MSRKYADRVTELAEFKNGFNIFKTKIRFTYEPIPEIFQELGTKLKANVGNVFQTASLKMQTETASAAWEHTLEEEKNWNLKKEDVHILKNLGKLLGKTDVEGQTSEIELVETFLQTQIEKAEKEREKNEKLYKTLGVILGLTIVIILL